MAEYQSTAKLTILDRVGYTYFETDLQGRITSVNDALCKALGYKRDELIGLLLSSIATCSKDALVFDTVLQTRQPRMDLEYCMRTKDGAMIYAEGGVSLKQSASGEPVGFRGVMHDITVHKNNEEVLQKANERFEKELEIGRKIQASFLPQHIPECTGWEIGVHIEAARHVSGDFYDAFVLSDGNRVGFVVADVCDKGVGAALFMALIRSLVRAFAMQYFTLLPAGCSDVLSSSPGMPGYGSLANIIGLTNTYLIDNHGDTSMFATLFFGVLDPVEGIIEYVNAGHEPPYIIGKDGIVTRLPPTGPAVGLLPDFQYTVAQMQLEKGQMLVAYTDGVVDALSPSGISFNIHRLEASLEQYVPSAGGQLEIIKDNIRAHISGAEQYDDITLLAVHRQM